MRRRIDARKARQRRYNELRLIRKAWAGRAMLPSLALMASRSARRSASSMDEKINIDDLIAHKMLLEKINDAFDLMHKGESIRSVAV